MADAALADTQARKAKPPRPAMHKLKLLPEVVAMLSRNGRDVESAVVDADNNLLESVRFFLEPLEDGSLPAYNIQRELFTCLTRLPINKDALIASKIGTVVLFYTKSKKPELAIKRHAERLLAEWTRPILKRSDDFRKRAVEQMEYDPSRSVARKAAAGDKPAMSQADIVIRARQKAAAASVGNRARLDHEIRTYTIAPKSNLANIQRGRR